MEQAQAGDRRAVAGLYELHAERLFRQVIYPCAPDPSTAEDILKETFLKVIEQIQGFRWDESRGVFPWLARVAKNRAMDRHRKLATEGRAQAPYRQFLEQLMPGQADDPESLLGQEQELHLLKARVGALLAQLNPRYRQAIELRLFEEKSREECAATLEVQVGTFDVLFYRAIRAFRKKWDQPREATKGEDT